VFEGTYIRYWLDGYGRFWKQAVDTWSALILLAWTLEHGASTSMACRRTWNVECGMCWSPEPRTRAQIHSQMLRRTDSEALTTRSPKNSAKDSKLLAWQSLHTLRKSLGVLGGRVHEV